MKNFSTDFEERERRNWEGSADPIEKDGNLHCPYCDADFADKIGIEMPHVYDGTLYWKCKKCGGNYHRFKDERMGSGSV